MVRAVKSVSEVPVVADTKKARAPAKAAKKEEVAVAPVVATTTTETAVDAKKKSRTSKPKAAKTEVVDAKETVVAMVAVPLSSD
jgi:hypothetical protein